MISRVGEDRILVQMPGVENPAQLRALLGSTAKMSFQMVAAGPGPGVTLLPLRDGSGKIPVEDRVALSGDRLDSAASGFDPGTGRPMVTFDFDRQGGAAFAEITAANIGQRFAVVLDGEVLTAPVIQQAIPGGQGQITGDFTVEEAQTLAVLLTSGALPASLDVIEERSVGAALGADSIRAGMITGVIGLALVVAIMVGLYGGWGLLASAVLGVNVMLTLTALGFLGATLTLPGIAGIILCLGIAVDSNILIFSRIREETAKGAVAIKALTLGYGRAWATILDANITTLLAMVLLVHVRRRGDPRICRHHEPWHTDLDVHGGRPHAFHDGDAGAPPQTQAAGHQTADRKGARAREPVLHAARKAGAGGLGRSVCGLARPAGDAGADARDRFHRWGADGAALGRACSSVGIAHRPCGAGSGRRQPAGLRSAQRGVDPGAGRGRSGHGGGRRTGGDGRSSPMRVFAQIDLVGPTVSGELASTGLLALGLAVLAMLAYIWVRFEWHFAAGAIAVLFLDVTKTFGVIALMGWEVNLTTIVALLTLIGYSVNDKVVVYDRIRENLAAGDAPLAEVIDRSLNQVLARCIFTSGTTLAAILPMAIWGGPAVAGFAWPMIAGVTIATASSLFVAGPVLAWLAQRHLGPVHSGGSPESGLIQASAGGTAFPRV